MSRKTHNRRAFLRSILLVGVVALLATGAAWLALGRGQTTAQTTVYTNDFSSSAGREWSPSTTISTSPSGEKFLGNPFDNITESLTLQDLPAHTEVTISFDLYISPVMGWQRGGLLPRARLLECRRIWRPRAPAHHDFLERKRYGDSVVPRPTPR